MIRAGIASVPNRQDSLGRTVASLRGQVDRLGVYLNGYDAVPDFLDGCDVVRSQDEGDRGDAGKFFWIEDGADVYLGCDDDLLYPPDYVATIAAGLEDCQRRAVVGFHGSVFRLPMRSVIEDRVTVYRCLKEVPEPHLVHLLGSGACAIARDMPPLRRADFALPNMADLWLSWAAHAWQIPLVVLPHAEGWLQPARKDNDDTIWHWTTRLLSPLREQQNRVAAKIPWPAL